MCIRTPGAFLVESSANLAGRPTDSQATFVPQFEIVFAKAMPRWSALTFWPASVLALAGWIRAWKGVFQAESVIHMDGQDGQDETEGVTKWISCPSCVSMLKRALFNSNSAKRLGDKVSEYAIQWESAGERGTHICG
jgi:hypothetical protein